MKRAFERLKMKARDDESKVVAETQSDDDEFLRRYLPGSSPAMRQLRQAIVRLNSHRGVSLVNLILIRGESGVGKGYVARVYQ
jgi:DNA-binding NtrC family response regulator